MEVQKDFKELLELFNAHKVQYLIVVQEGIPYQTLVSSIIHKYVSGYLIERKKA